MRAVHVGDMVSAAQVLLMHDPHDWDRLLQTFLDETHAAHMFHKRYRKPHPTWGNGSLTARVKREECEAGLRTGDTRFLIALVAVVHAITVWQTRYKTRVSFARTHAMLTFKEDRPCRIPDPS